MKVNKESTNFFHITYRCLPGIDWSGAGCWGDKHYK